MGRVLVRLGLTAAFIGLLSVGVSLVPNLLSRLEVFRVHGVRMEGARYLDAEQSLASLTLPVGASVWDDPGSWLETLRTHPLVVSADVRRLLPDSLVIVVTEREPVALVSTPTLEPVDAEGRALPIDPSRHPLDLPLLRMDRLGTTGEATSLKIRPLARELERFAHMDPSFLESVSELAWLGPHDVVAVLRDPGVSIRFRPPLTPEMLQAAKTVMSDAVLRYPGRRLRSVDLRYADQVVVRF